MDVKRLLKKWRVVLAALLVTLILSFAFPEAGRKALTLLGVNISTILGILVPVFVLLGLFDVWIPRERIAPHLGEGSGLRGIVLAVFLGAASAGPLYVAFPVAEVMLRKGTTLKNVFIFLGAWSSMRLPMALFEMQSLGPVFAISRYVASLCSVLVMGVLMDRLLGVKEKEIIGGRYGEGLPVNLDSPMGKEGVNP
jgi:uncharacterized membrane protein YraQ (UPF0718 family)